MMCEELQRFRSSDCKVIDSAEPNTLPFAPVIEFILTMVLCVLTNVLHTLQYITLHRLRIQAFGFKIRKNARILLLYQNW